MIIKDDVPQVGVYYDGQVICLCISKGLLYAGDDVNGIVRRCSVPDGRHRLPIRYANLQIGVPITVDSQCAPALLQYLCTRDICQNITF